MNRGRIERVRSPINAQEAGGLFKGLRPQARHLLQFLAGGKRTVVIAVGHDIGGNGGVNTRHALQ